jgi:galactose mutarotase-like enzyme
MPDGTQVDKYTLTSKHGVRVAILNYGGIIQSIVVPEKNGQPGDIALGFDRLDARINDPAANLFIEVYSTLPAREFCTPTRKSGIDRLGHPDSLTINCKRQSITSMKRRARRRFLQLAPSIRPSWRLPEPRLAYSEKGREMQGLIFLG